MHITDFNTYCEFCLNALASSHFAFLPFVVLLYLLFLIFHFSCSSHAWLCGRIRWSCISLAETASVVLWRPAEAVRQSGGWPLECRATRIANFSIKLAQHSSALRVAMRFPSTAERPCVRSKVFFSINVTSRRGLRLALPRVWRSSVRGKMLRTCKNYPTPFTLAMRYCCTVGFSMFDISL